MVLYCKNYNDLKQFRQLSQYIAQSQNTGVSAIENSTISNETDTIYFLDTAHILHALENKLKNK